MSGEDYNDCVSSDMTNQSNANEQNNNSNDNEDKPRDSEKEKQQINSANKERTHFYNEDSEPDSPDSKNLVNSDDLPSSFNSDGAPKIFDNFKMSSNSSDVNSRSGENEKHHALEDLSNVANSNTTSGTASSSAEGPITELESFGTSKRRSSTDAMEISDSQPQAEVAKSSTTEESLARSSSTSTEESEDDSSKDRKKKRGGKKLGWDRRSSEDREGGDTAWQEPRQADDKGKNVTLNKAKGTVEQTLYDFCSSRLVSMMRHTFDGYSRNFSANKRNGLMRELAQLDWRDTLTCEVLKEGVIIGKLDVFSEASYKEFLVPLRDDVLRAFLEEPGMFRAICYRTKCQVEITRRIVNRKLCSGGRWIKYIVLRISGNNERSIENCDLLLQKSIPEFKNRLEYEMHAHCSVYFKENIPDNTRLYYNYQRTGATTNRFGHLMLQSPYGQFKGKSAGFSPWKVGSMQQGKLCFSSGRVRRCMKHLYPDYGFVTSASVPSNCIGPAAASRVDQMQEALRKQRLHEPALRRQMAIPVYK